MERHQFDDNWREAFAGGEVAPAASVWTAVELGLARGEKEAMRKRIVFYQRLAAGLALIILAGAGTFYFSSSQETVPSLADGTSDKQVQSPQAESNQTLTPEPEALAKEKSQPAAKSYQPGLQQASSEGQVAGVNTILPDAMVETGLNRLPQSPKAPRLADQHPFTSFVQAQMPVNVTAKMRRIELVRELPAMPASFMASAEKKESGSQVWASLGGAAGAYNPNGQSGGFAEAAVSDKLGTVTNNTSSTASSLSTGSAYSVGMNAGMKVSRKWVVQSGINYINQSVDYRSNIASLDASNRSFAYAAQFDAGLNAGGFRVTSPYTVNNSMEFVSIPVQAGWVAVDRRFGLQVNSGISTDLFVRSTLVDESGRFDKFTQSSGSASPIRPVNFSGLFSTEMSYRLGDHYGLAIVPGVRYSLAPLSKPGEGNLGNALIWDVGFRLRYHFK